MDDDNIAYTKITDLEFIGCFQWTSFTDRDQS